jgi:Holliday junction resolvasome RuvABC ATP-dependent DNA helicase subunit
MLKYIVCKHGLDDKNLSESLSKILMTPIPRLRNPKTIANMTKEQWQEFIESIISPGAEKDHRLKLIYKSHLLRGRNQRYNPHTLLITNPGTGKTTFYDVVGQTIDKTSKSRLIGFSDAQNARPGLIDNLNVVLCIEQIESQSAPEILAFLLSFMEKGKAR